jgi:hypothetical protein
MSNFFKKKIMFFWASWECEYPFPTKISMEVPEIIDFRKSKQTSSIWHGKIMEPDILGEMADKENKPIYVFSFGFDQDIEMACIENVDIIHPPRQPTLI